MIIIYYLNLKISPLNRFLRPHLFHSHSQLLFGLPNLAEILIKQNYYLRFGFRTRFFCKACSNKLNCFKNPPNYEILWN